MNSLEVIAVSSSVSKHRVLLITSSNLETQNAYKRASHNGVHHKHGLCVYSGIYNDHVLWPSLKHIYRAYIPQSFKYSLRRTA